MEPKPISLLIPVAISALIFNLKGKVHLSTFRAYTNASTQYSQFAGSFEAMLQLAILERLSRHLVEQGELSLNTIGQIVNSM